MPEDPGDNLHAATTPSADGGWLIAGRYRVLHRLGAGAMADVFRARDETLERDVAVKVFRTVVDEADTAGNARRELELQALAQLSHPNLITLFDGSVSDSASDGPAFLALELVEGPTLAEVLRDGALREPEVRRIGGQLADALAYIHERRMVHRDVKPANILLGSDNHGDPSAVRARLSDFGIVRIVDNAQVTSTELTVGTAYYIAPEQARSAAVGPEADVYALGLVLVEALTGRRAFEGEMHEVLAARLSRNPHIPSDLPEPWPALLTKMTAFDPADRPSAVDVARTLRSSADTAAVPIADAGWLPSEFGDHTGFARAAADARTAAVLRAGVPLTVLPPSFPAPNGRSPQSGPEPDPELNAELNPEEGHHRVNRLFVAAAACLVVIAGAGWYLLRPSGHATPQPTHVGGATTGTSSATAGGGHASPPSSPIHRHAVAPGPTQPVNHTFARAAHPHRHRPSPASTTPASTRSVPPTTAPPTQPRTTTGPPPSTSVPPSSTGPPTSAPPSTTSPPTSAPPSTANSSSSAPGQTDLAAGQQ